MSIKKQELSFIELFNESRDGTIGKYLESYQVHTNGLSDVPDSFIFLYGPYLIDNPIYRNIVEKIANTNKIMRFMILCSYSLQKLKSTKNKSEKRNIVKMVTIMAEKHFPDDTKYKDAMGSFVKEYIVPIATESAMVGMAPIVPYGASVSFDEIYVDTTIPKASDDYETVLLDLLLNNIFDILRAEPSLPEPFDDIGGNIVPGELDLMLGSSNMDSICKKYYTYAIFNHFKISMKTANEYDNYLKVVLGTNPDKDIMSAVEALGSNPLIGALESVDSDINQLLHINLDKYDKDSDSKSYDLEVIDNFIFMNRYMDFNESANLLFLSNTKKQIVNINDRGNDRIYYELANNIIVCPFTSFEDYTTKLIVYDKTNVYVTSEMM